MRVNIGQKLTLSFLLVALLVGLVGYVGYSNMRKTARQVDAMAGEAAGLVKLSEMKFQILEAIEEASAYGISGEQDEKSEFFERLQEFDSSASEFNANSLIGKRGQSEEIKLFNQILSAKENLKLAADSSFLSYERDGVEILSHGSPLDDAMHALILLIDRFVDFESDEVAEAQEEIASRFANAQLVTIIVVSIATLLAIGMGMRISRSIAIPINRLSDAASRIGRGELATLDDIHSRDEIGDLAVSFSKMVEARQQAEDQREALISELWNKNAELERFTYTVSHDLKSPLLSIRGFLGVLKQDIDRGDAEQITVDLARIADGADDMAKLLDELLELSRIGRVVGTPEEVALDEVAQAAVRQVAGLVEDRSVHVTVASGLPVVLGDRTRIQEVLQNLVENAIKFMGEEPDPIVEIGECQKNGERVVFVRDNGIGINPRYNHKVFDLFDKLDQNTAGSGVGLALVKRIVEVHGGRVWVESEGLGHGSTFYFTLPSKRGAQNNDSV